VKTFMKSSAFGFLLDASSFRSCSIFSSIQVLSFLQSGKELLGDLLLQRGHSSPTPSETAPERSPRY
jgi:hypothetical protein